MKAQGTDGLSRGHMREGVSLGECMEQFCPWGKIALEREPKLSDWFKQLMGDDIEILTPEQWFTRGHDHDGGQLDSKGYWRLNIRPSKYLWQPPTRCS